MMMKLFNFFRRKPEKKPQSQGSQFVPTPRPQKPNAVPASVRTDIPSEVELAGHIRAYVKLCVQNPAIQDEPLLERLVARGISEKLAFQVNVFTPIAFTHYLLKQDITFSSDYMLMHPDTKATQTYPIQQQPVYAAALWLTPYFVETLTPVAGRSAEFKTINSVLNKGHKRSDLSSMTISPPVIMTRYESL